MIINEEALINNNTHFLISLLKAITVNDFDQAINQLISCRDGMQGTEPVAYNIPPMRFTAKEMMTAMSVISYCFHGLDVKKLET
jgi:hypothetical protein